MGSARPVSASQATMAAPPSSADWPSKRPLLTRTSPSVCAMNAASTGALASTPGAATTRRIGNPNFCANRKSRSSWAGTAMIAPVP